jgi:hypothetical protein
VGFYPPQSRKKGPSGPFFIKGNDGGNTGIVACGQCYRKRRIIDFGEKEQSLTALKYSFFSRKIGGKLGSMDKTNDTIKQNDDEQGEDREEREQRSLLKAFAGTVKHYLGKWQSVFEGVRDPRNPEMIIYPLEGMMCTGVLMFLYRLGHGERSTTN